uniref:Uncharacterized protein n=1 Tax=Setaria viridis TaxID=4556 RepID=A0A4U6U6E3_SETVI|nr:hypothetical protein SEVIR_6G221900v2 [Setaria viridis]
MQVLHLQARVCMCVLQEQGIDEKPLLKTHIAGIYRNTSCSCRALTYYHWTCFFVLTLHRPICGYMTVFARTPPSCQ